MGRWDLSWIRGDSDSIWGNFFSARTVKHWNQLSKDLLQSPSLDFCLKGWWDKVLNNLIWSHSRPCLAQVGLDTSHGPFPPELFYDFAILCAMILPCYGNEKWLLSTAIQGYCSVNRACWKNTFLGCFWPDPLIGRWTWVTEMCFSSSTMEYSSGDLFESDFCLSASFVLTSLGCGWFGFVSKPSWCLQYPFCDMCLLLQHTRMNLKPLLKMKPLA